MILVKGGTVQQAAEAFLILYVTLLCTSSVKTEHITLGMAIPFQKKTQLGILSNLNVQILSSRESSLYVKTLKSSF